MRKSWPGRGGGLDGLVHLPGDAAVAEVAGDAGAEFGDVEGFGEVHLEHGAAAGGEGEEVLGGVVRLRDASRCREAMWKAA